MLQGSPPLRLQRASPPSVSPCSSTSSALLASCSHVLPQKLKPLRPRQLSASLLQQRSSPCYCAKASAPMGATCTQGARAIAGSRSAFLLLHIRWPIRDLQCPLASLNCLSHAPRHVLRLAHQASLLTGQSSGKLSHPSDRAGLMLGMSAASTSAPAADPNGQLWVEKHEPQKRQTERSAQV